MPTNEAFHLNRKALENVSFQGNANDTTKQRTSTRTKEETSSLIISYKGYGFITILDIG
jgi:hypothetical protein